eukprot:Rhum_TRINITY_DN16486_c0_g1::Rhum_TRINITY_DN16486_c0_g1_i1::g.163305::m.163305/K02872/RP-L13Ae, RPL13A; large subunit ribosomal protein L13Ae
MGAVMRHTAKPAKSKGVVIDMRGHLIGRICSVVAKQLMMGQKVTLVRCEGAQMSGSFIRNKLKFLNILRKRHMTNPKRGPFHPRSPSAIITRKVRGMITKNERNHAKRGKAAMARLTCYEGVPKSVERTKRMVCPSALRVLRLAPNRDYCTLGRLSHEVGWKHQDVIAKLEEERKARGAKYYELKKQTNRLRTEAKAEANKELGKEQADLLAQFGY